MSRIIKAGLIQAHNVGPVGGSIEEVKKANIDHQMKMVEDAASQGVQMLCFQEIFTTPYFCAEQETKWYEAVEKVPGGKTVRMMQEVAKQHGMVLIVSIYEEEMSGIYYNTAAVIDADGKYLGKYRKNHIPHVAPGFWEKFYFRPGNLGYPCFDTAFARIGVYICYDRHFPEGARALGLNGAEIIFNPSATVAGLSEYLWKLEQPAHAVANGYFVGAINRVGHEQPWDIGEFYGQSYFCDPRGQMLVEASRDQDELVVADLDMDVIREVRNTWQFFRDRRPETSPTRELGLISGQLLSQALDELRQEMEDDSELARRKSALLTYATEGAAIATSAGLLSLLLRSGSLMGAAISSLPLWRRVDPLAVLALSDEEREKLEADLRKAEETEDEEDEGVGRVLDGVDSDPEGGEANAGS